MNHKRVFSTNLVMPDRKLIILHGARKHKNNVLHIRRLGPQFFPKNKRGESYKRNRLLLDLKSGISLNITAE